MDKEKWLTPVKKLSPESEVTFRSKVLEQMYSHYRALHKGDHLGYLKAQPTTVIAPAQGGESWLDAIVLVGYNEDNIHLEEAVQEEDLIRIPFSYDKEPGTRNEIVMRTSSPNITNSHIRTIAPVLNFNSVRLDKYENEKLVSKVKNSMVKMTPITKGSPSTLGGESYVTDSAIFVSYHDTVRHGLHLPDVVFANAVHKIVT